MDVVLSSIAAIIAAVFVKIIVVPQVLKATVWAGVVMSGGGQSEGGGIPAFVGMFVLLTGWAYLCFAKADLLAGEDIGQRWVLLIAAAGLVSDRKPS